MASPDATLGFDAAFYPHLMDMIISAAPLGALLNLRRTSRVLRNRVNQLIGNCHLIITPDATGQDVVFAFRDGDSRIIAKDIELAISLARFTRVLDFSNRIKQKKLREVADTLDLYRLDMVRVLDFYQVTGDFPFDASTYVVTINGFGPSELYNNNESIVIPDGTIRVVLNVVTNGAYHYVSLGSKKLPLLEVDDVETVDDIVLIFTEAFGPYPSECIAPHDYRHKVRDALSTSTRCPYLLVDSWQLAPRDTGGPRTTRPHNWQPGPREVTREDYCLSVGDEIFALETMAPETMG